MKKISNFITSHKVLFMLIAMLTICITSTFAGTDGSVDTSDMDARMKKVVDFFNGGWVKALCCILLIGECLGLLFAGGQNPQIFKKFLPFIIGTVLFMCAGKIVTIIWGAKDTNFSADLTDNIQIMKSQENQNIPYKIGKYEFQFIS